MKSFKETIPKKVKGTVSDRYHQHDSQAPFIEQQRQHQHQNPGMVYHQHNSSHIPIYNTQVAGASTSTNQSSRYNFDTYNHPSGIPSAYANTFLIRPFIRAVFTNWE